MCVKLVFAIRQTFLSYRNGSKLVIRLDIAILITLVYLVSCHIMDIIYGQFLVRKQISLFFTRRCALRTILILGFLEIKLNFFSLSSLPPSPLCPSLTPSLSVCLSVCLSVSLSLSSRSYVSLAKQKIWHLKASFLF